MRIFASRVTTLTLACLSDAAFTKYNERGSCSGAETRSPSSCRGIERIRVRSTASVVVEGKVML